MGIIYKTAVHVRYYIRCISKPKWRFARTVQPFYLNFLVVHACDREVLTADIRWQVYRKCVHFVKAPLRTYIQIVIIIIRSAVLSPSIRWTTERLGEAVGCGFKQIDIGHTFKAKNIIRTISQGFYGIKILSQLCKTLYNLITRLNSKTHDIAYTKLSSL